MTHVLRTPHAVLCGTQRGDLLDCHCWVLVGDRRRYRVADLLVSVLVCLGYVDRCCDQVVVSVPVGGA